MEYGMIHPLSDDRAPKVTGGEKSTQYQEKDES
jgi:hypothetical protein